MSISDSRSFISSLKENQDRFYLVHYSCQSLNDENESLSPRITSVAVTHYSSGQTVSFSTHAIAEELGIRREDVRARFDEVELRLLSDFYEFVRDRSDRYWVHWNMRNLTYGFEHLEHRYRVLSRKRSPTIPVESRINLNDMLADRYGANFAPHPRLLSLMEINGGRHRDFLSGAEEVEAFQAGDFLKMHNSTLCKVGFFHKAMSLMSRGKLRTKSRSLGALLDKLFESRPAKLVGLIGATITTLLAIVSITLGFEE